MLPVYEIDDQERVQQHDYALDHRLLKDFEGVSYIDTAAQYSCPWLPDAELLKMR